MTTPNVNFEFEPFVWSYVLAPNTPGFQFARIKAPKAPTKDDWQIPMPVGVHTVSISCLSPSALTVQLSQPGSNPSVQQTRLSIPAGDSQRTAVAEVPVLLEGSTLNVTMRKAAESDVGQPVIGVKIFPVPTTN